eukprot:CAMPEP_0170076012 /NCGR_PEP_ID=MMETSP0019_2-20121128/13051_1 /TAXON_ID=98059 /ORGANISM="Dinobryon sp., Strain UTEXLB2267" /LENGTH=306 /DNA_ID=CAMNT_0010287359 /DNA_START=1 /DNA_END=921 /DNA_ORIENTATION=+
MWSSAFTGRSSIVLDSCHRVFIEFDENTFENAEEQLKFCNKLCEEKFFHFSISLLGQRQTSKLEKFITSLNTIRSSIIMNNAGYKMNANFFITLVIDSLSPSEMSIVSQCDVNLLLIEKRTDISREKFVSYYMETTSAVINNKTSFGIGGIEDIKDLEWVLSKIPRNKLEVVHCGYLHLPNIYSRTIELIHSWGYNVMISVAKTADDLQRMKESKQLLNLQTSYELSADVLIAKCMLQLGCIVGLKLNPFSPEYIMKHFSRLVHPFVHRKPFVSSNKIITLAVNEEDVLDIVTASQMIEDAICNES